MSTTLSMPIQRGLALLLALAMALGVLLPLAAATPVSAQSTELFLSEYIEGSSNNKALEIYNGTGAPVDLVAGAYNVQMFFNGSASAGLTINLGDGASPDVVATGDVFVVAQASASATILAQADQTNGSGWFNGDDAVVLRKGTTVVDVIGQIGFDPGTEWGAGLTSTADNTLRRKAAIEAGDPNGADAFDPSVEWDGFATDTFDGLGAHTVVEGDTAPSVTSTTPTDGATGVPGATNISVTFSEPVAVADGWYSIECTTSGPVTATVSGGPTTWTLDPDADLVVGETCTVTIMATQVTDVDTDDPPDTMAADHVFSFTTGDICTSPSHLISQVQGSGSVTPILPTLDVSVRGVVTADFTSGGDTGIPANQGLRGFFLEAATGDRDADDATSEGIFVFDGGAVFTGGVGDVVAVQGRASEFSEVTQITASQVLLCDVELELPAPADLPLPLALDQRNAVLEPLESMRVTHPELTVVEFFQLERFGEIRLSASGVLQTPTNVVLPGDDANALLATNQAATIILDDGRSGQNLNLLDNGDDYLPYVRAGDTLRIGDQLLDHTAVLHFGFGAWRLQPVDIDAITDELAANRTRPRNEQPPSVGGNLKVASFNVLNYFNGDGQGGGFPTTRGAVTASEFERQTEKLVDAITRLGADVYGLIEIENDGGEFQAARTLVDALNAEVGPDTYRFVDTGVIGTDEIKQAFIYDRRTVRPVGDWAILTSAVDPRFDDDLSRPALAQTFVRLGSGERVTVVVNHLKSKGQSGLTDMTDPNFDQFDGQGFWNAARTEAAEALADWVAGNPTGENAVGTLIIGDLNAYGQEDPIRALEDGGFEDQLVLHTDGIPYTFTFDGMQGTLDTALADEELRDRVTGAAVWHLNADEVPAIDYLESVGVSFNQRFRTPEIAQAYYDPSAFRSSDHDPVVIGIDLGRSPNQLKR